MPQGDKFIGILVALLLFLKDTPDRRLQCVNSFTFMLKHFVYLTMLSLNALYLPSFVRYFGHELLLVTLHPHMNLFVKGKTLLNT
jgi:hypothetical protein